MNDQQWDLLLEIVTDIRNGVRKQNGRIRKLEITVACIIVALGYAGIKIFGI